MTETIDARLRRGVAAHEAGHLVEAARIYRDVLADEPDNKLAHYHLGRAAMQRNSYAEAETEFAAAISADPSEAMLHVLMADVMLKLRRPEEARKSAQRALGINPLLPAALARLGSASMALGKIKEAEKALGQALSISAKNEDALRAMIGLRLRQRQFAEAERLAMDLLRAYPSHAEGYVLFGDCYFEQGRFVQAIMAYRRARTISIGNSAADEKYRNALARLGGYDTARTALEVAVRSSSDLVLANMVLGDFLNDYGFTEESVRCYRAALAADPTNSQAHWSLAYTHRFRSHDEPDFRTLEETYRAAPIERGRRYLLSFAMGKAMEDIGAYEEGLDYSIEGNRLQRQQRSYQLESDIHLLDGVERAWASPRSGETRRGTGLGPTPIFVVGMPRSGTTLTEQVLAGDPRVYGAGELDFLHVIARSVVNADPVAEASTFVEAATPEHYRRIAATYRQWLPAEARAKRFVVDKMPHNFRLVGLIRQAFPEARIVHVRRNPVDNCVSMFKIPFASASLGFSNDLADLGRYYNLYRHMMQHWNEVLPGAVFDLRYEDLVADPEATSRALFDYCGLDWSPEVLAFHERKGEVRTASVSQVRRPIYKDSVDRSARYGAKLDPLRAALAEWDGAQ